MAIIVPVRIVQMVFEGKGAYDMDFFTQIQKMRRQIEKMDMSLMISVSKAKLRNSVAIVLSAHERRSHAQLRRCFALHKISTIH